METAKFTTQDQITQAKALLKNIQDQGKLIPANDKAAILNHNKSVLIQQSNIRILEVLNIVRSNP